MNEATDELESRVLLLAPTARDGAFTKELFSQAQIVTHVCQSMREVCTEMTRGAGMLVLATEFIETADSVALANFLEEQPPWSDLPVLLLVSPKAEGLFLSEYLKKIHSVTYLKCPVEVVAVLTAVKSGLRDRKRQYAVREYLIERERQSQALLDADRRKDEFLATLAHELRNPLSPLRSGIDLLSLEEENPEQQMILGMMDRQLHQMVRLVDDLLDVSRITRDKLILATDIVEIQSVIQASIETTKQLVSSSQITLKSDIPLQSIFVRGDHTRLTQVISNLLNNAIKYSEVASEIELKVETVGDEVSMSVKDSGIGIPQEMLGRVFEMFTQVDSSLTRSRGGLGIGLTLVRRIVEMHGGRVIALSEGVDKGSTFQVFLKCVHESVKAENTEDQFFSSVDSRRVLIVDDTRAARLMLSKLLRKLGHEVFEADCGRHALEQIQSIKPDVVISDIGMPEMDGYELARNIRTMNSGIHPLLIALTGYGQDTDRLRAINAGFDVHLVKPVSAVDLQKTLANKAAHMRL